MNVPKLRFPEFHDDYEELKYKNILKIKSGKNQKFVECKNGKYPILGTGGKIGETNNFLFDKPSVLIGRKGTINKPQYLEIPFWTVDTLFYTDIFYPNIPKYIYYTFQNVNWEKYDESTGVPSLNASTIESIKCNIPHYTEQQKVADFFSLLDKKIEFQAQKIEALKLFKSGIKNKIMNVNCDPILLGDIIKKWNLKNKKNIINYIESISNKYGFISQKEQFDERKITSTDLSNYYIIKKNVFAYNPSRLDVGSLALKKDNHVSIISPLYVCFTTKENNEYLFEWFNSKYFKKEIYSKFEGGVRNTLNFNSLSSVKINIPNLNEQNKIVNILREFNEKINVESVKLDKLNELKKGLMQNMFV